MLVNKYENPAFSLPADESGFFSIIYQAGGGAGCFFKRQQPSRFEDTVHLRQHAAEASGNVAEAENKG